MMGVICWAARHLFPRPQPKPEHFCCVHGCDRPATREDHFWHIRTCDDHVPQMVVMSKSRKVTRRRRDEGRGGPRPLP